MPPLSRHFIRLSLIYLFSGFTLGMLLLANKGVPFYPPTWRLLTAHIEFVLMGWVVNLVMGVAFWIAPRFWKPPKRGNEAGAKWALWLLNAGVAFVVLSYWIAPPLPVRLLGRLLETSAIIAFTLHLWRRIVPRSG